MDEQGVDPVIAMAARRKERHWCASPSWNLTIKLSPEPLVKIDMGIIFLENKHNTNRGQANRPDVLGNLSV